MFMESEAGAGFVGSVAGSERGTKKPFHTERGVRFDHARFLQEVSARTGVDPVRLAELEKNMSLRLSVEEYSEFKRAPAAMVPVQVLAERKSEVLEVLASAGRSKDSEKGEFPDKFGIADLQEFDNFLKPEAKTLEPFVRIRPKWLIYSLSKAGLLVNEVLQMAKDCYRSNFTINRYCATVSLYSALSGGARKELRFMLDNGGFEVDDHNWIKIAKKHHELVKVTRMCLTQADQLDVEEIADYLYFAQTTGRGFFMQPTEVDEEVAARTRVPDDYKMPGHTSDEMGEFLIGKWFGAMSHTGRLKKTSTWNEFLDVLYLKLPGGSAAKVKGIDLEAVGGIEGLRAAVSKEIRGNKRFTMELTEMRHFREFSKWDVIAFLKYEVAKNRWLYPAQLEWVILGLYLMDHCIDAFNGASGVDIGHTVESSMAVKAAVLDMVRSDTVCVNTDGKGFNENHSRRDMTTVVDLLAHCAGRTAVGASQGLAELEEGVSKYKEGMLGRRITLPKLAKGWTERTFEVSNTLFSGEATTQLVNTFWIGSAAMAGSEVLKKQDMLAFLKAFYKGDDLNGFVASWLQGWLLLVTMEDCGFIFAPEKDHVENKMCEHERCIVTAKGYQGSKARRIGAMVCAENQGSQGLTMRESLVAANEARMSLICRGVDVVLARCLFRATVRTYYNGDGMSTQFWANCGVPKVNGGFGLWNDTKTYRSKHSPPPDVRTVFTLKEDGVLGNFGSAQMTDRLLKKICEEHGLDHNDLKGEREEMIGNAYIAALSEGAKYGPRRASNAAEVANRCNQFMHSEVRVWPSDIAMDIAQRAKKDLWEALADPDSLGARRWQTPNDIVQTVISQSGLLTERLYMKVNQLNSRGALYERVGNSLQRGPDSVMMSCVRKWSRHAWLAICGDEVAVMFNEEGDRASAETLALVRRVTLYHMAMSGTEPQMRWGKTLNAAVSLEVTAIYIARQVWGTCGGRLAALSF